MKKYILFFLFFFILSCTNSDKKINFISLKKNKTKQAYLKFCLKKFNYGIEIYLLEDFTFKNRLYTYACFGGLYIKDVIGNFKIKENQIIFNPQKIIFMQDDNAHPGDSISNIDTVNYYYSDSTKIQTQYDFIKLTNNIAFLISSNDFGKYDECFPISSNYIALANLYNSNYNTETSKFLLSNKDTIINFNNFPLTNLIPTKWKEYFLHQPINAKILSVRVKSIYEMLIPIYKLDSGNKKGIRKGMTLYYNNDIYRDVCITEVYDDYSIALGNNIFYENTKLKIGNILSTQINNSLK